MATIARSSIQLPALITSPWVKALLAAIAIIGAAIAIYRPILVTTDDVALYPWASDTLGHLLKAEFIAGAFQSDDFYPRLFPDWYGGVQLLRYHPPVPYYVLAALFLLSNDIVFTAGAFVFGAALLGGLSFLLYRRWLGFFPATIAGILFMSLPDNIRVALAEGNLPRVLATALLPVTFYILVSMLTLGPSRAKFVLLAILVMLVVLTHAMMGAIFVVCFTIVTVTYWVITRAQPRTVGVVLAAVYGGVLLSGWWLVPSLSGGITELSADATTEALVSFPFAVTLDPLVRNEDKEIYYVGLSLVLGTLAALAVWRRCSPLSRSVIVAALPLLLVSSTAFNPVYRALPLSELMWPIRFMTAAGFLALLGIMASASRLLGDGWKAKLFGSVLIAGLALDVIPSLSLIFVRPASVELAAVAESIQVRPGWRVATADLSRIGSRASYVLSAIGEREQVYGWAYQGSGIAPVLSGINFAMQSGFSAYAVDRLDEMGTDYVVRLKGAPIDPSFDTLLKGNGYTVAEETQTLILYYREGGPRAYVTHYPVLGIGDGARSLALLFPQMLVASSPRVDDYPLRALQDFPTLVLSGFSWHDKAKAEGLIRRYVSGGGRVVVDLTATRGDALSTRPKFLGVHGEPVSLYATPVLERGQERLPLRPFDSRYSPWTSLTPQAVDESTVTFSYLGEQATVVGHKEIGPGRVWFVGLNIPFHTVLTKDPVGISILEELLDLRAGSLPRREVVPLTGYQAGSEGYAFGYSIADDSTLSIPIARHDGTTVRVDGREVELLSAGSGIHFPAPSGSHSVRVTFRPTAIYYIGIATTGAAATLLFTGTIIVWSRRPAGSKPETAATEGPPRRSATREGRDQTWQ